MLVFITLAINRHYELSNTLIINYIYTTLCLHNVSGHPVVILVLCGHIWETWLLKKAPLFH